MYLFKHKVFKKAIALSHFITFSQTFLRRLDAYAINRLGNIKEINMDTLTAFVILAVAAALHASFQLSVSMLTLLSSHTIGKKRSKRKLVMLTSSFVSGSAVMTVLLLSFLALILTPILATGVSELVWTISCGIMMGTGVASGLFYYRKQAGTTLWLPRGMARFLSERAKKTDHSSEAFSLGITSVVAELLFIIAPLLVSALVLLHVSPVLQLAGIALYAAISLLPLLLVTLFVGNGMSIGRIQKWRESNKYFLQFAAGCGLLVLGFFIYIDQVVAVAVYTQGGM